MSIKQIIQDIYKIKTDYSHPDQVMDIAKSLEALSSDLYTDTKRFIYELLQNADDAVEENKKNQISIRLFDNFLVFAHKGKIFSNRDIQGLCGVKYGTKSSDKTKTGYKGIGFKSVFGQSKKVIIFSNKEYFRFEKTYSFGWKNTWSNSQEEWENENDREFSWHWQLIPIYTQSSYIREDINDFLTNENFSVATILKIDKKDEIINEVNSLIKNTNMFIFLRNIDKLDFFGNEIIEINNISDNEIILKHNSKPVSSWIVKKVELELDDAIRKEIKNDNNIPDKFKKTQSIELMLCAKKSDRGIQSLKKNESILYSYLPTSVSTNLPFLVNTSFIMGANRESLHNDSKLNQWIFNQIPQVLIKWISKLVESGYGFQSYNLFPNDLNLHPLLNDQFKIGLEKAIDEIPILMSHRKRLLKIKDSIHDEVKLHEQTFIEKKCFREFVLKEVNKDIDIKYSPFIIESGHEYKFRKYGLMGFSWDAFSKFLSDISFIDSHTLEDNIALIKFIKTSKKPDIIKNNTLKNWNFIYNHHNKLVTPKELFLPLIDDEHWKDEKSVSYLHEDIKEFILENNEYFKWLKKLGVEEKTDKAYFEKNILDKIENYANEKNTFSEMKRFFYMWMEGDISNENFKEFSKIDILTSKGTLKKVSQCYFSNIFNPDLKIETILIEDIFLNEEYLFKDEDKDQIKIFFKKLGVKDSMKLIVEDSRISKLDLNKKYDLNQDYFSSAGHQTGYSHLPIESYSSFVNLEFLEKTDSYTFSKVFWNYILSLYSVDKINIGSKGFWGYSTQRGYHTGQTVENYLKWYVMNNNCIPSFFKESKKSVDIYFLNNEMLDLCEDYLPIVDIENIEESWVSFFGFRTILEEKDYLTLYNRIITDVDSTSLIKQKNIDKIQKIIKYFLDNISSWDKNKLEDFSEWFYNQKHMSINSKCLELTELKFTFENDISIFGDKIEFICFSAENKSHQNFDKFIELVRIGKLTEKDLKIVKTGECRVSTLKLELEKKYPLLISYLQYFDSIFIDEKVEELRIKIEELEVYEFEELKTFCGSISSYFEKNVLNIRKSWKKESVQFELFDRLIKYFNLKGKQKELTFILRANIEDIKEEFDEKGIPIPDLQIVDIDNKEPNINISTGISSDEIIEDNKIIESNQDLLSSGIGTFKKLQEAYLNKKISKEFYHKAKSSGYLNYVQKIIEKSKDKILKYLSELDEYDCNELEFISDTVIGLKKHKEDFYIVIRPSDNNKVIIYDEAEVDILEYEESELWHASEINEPDIIRLGKILRDTGINRIPVND